MWRAPTEPAPPEMYRLGRIALWVPLTVAATVTVLSAQMAIIVGAVMIGIDRRDGDGPAGGRIADEPTAESFRVTVPDTSAETLAFFPLRPINPDSMILLPGEECYLQEPARLVLDAGELHRVGGRGGFSFGLPRNDQRRLRGGDARGERSGTSHGRIYVTNTRVVFIGTMNVNVHVAQILSLDRTPTGVMLGFINERPIEIITGNSRLWMTLYQVVHRTTETP